MTPFTSIASLAVPVLHANVDTDVITPMKRLTGGNARPLCDYAFEAWRYEDGDADNGRPLAGFPLNDSRYAGARIMLTGENFGCGSSRESAPRALLDLGFRCLIGTSFGDIFFNNCFQQGILPITVAPAELSRLAAWDGPIEVDLAAQTIRAGDWELTFEVNSLRKTSLLEGLDDISLTLRRDDAISAFQQRDRTRRPWVYAP